MAKKERQKVKQEQPKSAWVPVDMKAEGMQTGAQYGGILEMMRHTKQRYTLVKINKRLWRGGRYRWEPQWMLRDNGHEVHEVQPRGQLEVAMQEANAYIAEAEQADMEMADSHAVELPGGMTEEQFNQIFEDEEE